MNAPDPRAELRTAISAQATADAALARAADAVRHAKAILTDADADLRGFADLDGAIARHRVETMRRSMAEGAARPSMELPAELVRRIAEKRDAEQRLASLGSTRALLEAEREAAEQAATAAAATVHGAAVEVMFEEAQEIAEDVAAKVAQAKADLLRLDQLSSAIYIRGPYGLQPKISPEIRAAFAALPDHANLTKIPAAELATWRERGRAYLAALTADPDASLGDFIPDVAGAAP